MGMRGKRLGSWGGGRRGGRGPAEGARAGAGGGAVRAGAALASRAGGWADLPRDLLEAVAQAVPASDRLCFRQVCGRCAAAGKANGPAAGKGQLLPGKVTKTRGADAAKSVTLPQTGTSKFPRKSRTTGANVKSLRADQLQAKSTIKSSSGRRSTRAPKTNRRK